MRHITPSVFKDTNYTVGSTLITINFDEFLFNIDCSDTVFTYTPLLNGSSTIPSFFTMDSTARKIYITSTDSSDVGYYVVTISGSVPDGFSNTASFIL